MRVTTRLATAVATIAAVTALTACGGLQEASDAAAAVADTASTVQVCTEALSQATAVFDPGSPEQAVDQAHSAADRLNDLAANAADTTINEAITALADTMRAVTLEDLVLQPAAWLDDKARRVADLTAACTP
ncbi:bacteriophage spanin2 family protein [Saccharothrix sp. S26]|uniref:bacteriophage spanin2 family protein n=1 Tax=Saccharothrix sp. S26 TaxID=2907215 RepID=UPI001F244B61|nr:bacteriophage spanin2 family protein [Saccharothrix sp. S26]MCE7001078.1 bacteriophage spanin2 family protein [Saccharothrix sp. S26]